MRLKLKPWPLCKSQLINQFLLNHLALQLGSNFAQRMNATTISLNSSHASLVSHPNEIAELILNATKGSNG